MKKYFSVLALGVLLPFCSATASDQKSAPDSLHKSATADPRIFIGVWHTTITKYNPNRKFRKKPFSVGKRGAKIAALRAEAMQISMKHLPRLRPYASNYPRMVRTVRAYWRKHAANPNASRLTNMILKHVQEKYRFFVRSKLRAGITKGIRALKTKLRKS